MLLTSKHLHIHLTLFYCIIFTVSAQENNSPVTHSIFLVGDAGEPSTDRPLGKILREQIRITASNTTVLFLGDNIYPRGLPEPGSKLRSKGEKILQTQVGWIDGLNVAGIFIPGNHDWAHWGKKGLQFVNFQQSWFDSLKNPLFSLVPRDGCPGPVEIAVSDEITLVFLDTQWLLHQWDKPGAEGTCEAKTTAEVFNLLADVLERNKHKRVVIAAHHPLITYGDHGGVFSLKDHLFPLTDLNPKLYLPLPVIGSIYPIYRKFFGHIQDTSHPIYKEFSLPIQQLLKQYPGSLYVAGHEHALQYIVKDSTHYIVSGSAAKFSGVKKKGYAKFAKGVQGFVKIAFHENGAVIVHYFQADENNPEGREIFTTRIPAQKVNQHLPAESLPDLSMKYVRVKASEQYTAGPWRKKMLGKNYRAEWGQEIEVPVFDIGSEKGGLKILQRGGGQQTLSLRLEDKNGHEFVIRSVEKYPEKAMPEMFRKTFAQDLVQDQISASHPYAALVVPSLAEAAGIYHTNPKLFYVPDDPRLGEYRKEFANNLVLFEERPSGDWSDAAFFGQSDKIINTSKVLEKLTKDTDDRVDQEFVLKSRLFDMVIGDWDRHDDQWRWATLEGKKGDTFRPIPRDRDQAFFVSEGLLAKLWSRKWALPKFEGFDSDINWPSGLSFNARYFDRTFLNGLSQEQWINSAKKIQASLTDEVIEKSIRQWPQEIFDLHGNQIIGDLKARRDKLVGDAVSHYGFLAKQVDVVGSNKREQFEITRQLNGDSRVRVFKMNKEGEKEKKLYERLLKKNETKEIRVYGLDGDDAFRISGSSKRPILLRVIGGDGHDLVSDSTRSSCRAIFYDQPDQGSISPGSSVRDRRSVNPSVNEYDRKSFKYNLFAPVIYGNYNPDDGIFLGGGFIHIVHGFRKDPYKQRHLFLASVAPLTRSFNFKYQGKFNEVLGKWGLELDFDAKSPNYVNNFFGAGNETIFDRNIKGLPGMDVNKSIQYYRYRFNEIRFEPSLSHKLGSFAWFKAGPAFQQIEMEAPEAGTARFIESYASTLDYDLFERSNRFAGVAWQTGIEKRDDREFTRRGFTWHVSGRTMRGLNKNPGDFSSYESSMAVLHSFRSSARVVFGVRVGAGINTGNYEFYQSQILDGKTEMRGFRKTRFYGDSKFYSNFEMRVKLLSFRSYLFPASMGLLGFHDLGRVWYKDAAGKDPSALTRISNRWHKGWGGGLWFTPFNLTVLSTEVATSNEDGPMVYVRLGFLF